jgi:hypothetical protein
VIGNAVVVVGATDDATVVVARPAWDADEEHAVPTHSARATAAARTR